VSTSRGGSTRVAQSQAAMQRKDYVARFVLGDTFEHHHALRP
jgi:hypothetical protein